jgi:hypothetical protein
MNHEPRGAVPCGAGQWIGPLWKTALIVAAHRRAAAHSLETIGAVFVV